MLLFWQTTAASPGVVARQGWAQREEKASARGWTSSVGTSCPLYSVGLLSLGHPVDHG